MSGPSEPTDKTRGSESQTPRGVEHDAESLSRQIQAHLREQQLHHNHHDVHKHHGHHRGMLHGHVESSSADLHNVQIHGAETVGRQEHVVKKGENLWRIAKDAIGKDATQGQIARTVQEIVKENHINNPKLILPNQILQIPDLQIHPGQQTPRPGERTPKPGEQPAKPGEQPARPGEQPARPDEQPAKPGEQPAKPGEQPAKPGEQPAKPGEQPARPGEQPAKPGEQPAKPGEQPAKPGDQPAKPGDQPAKPGDQPAKPGDQPAKPGDHLPSPATNLLSQKSPTCRSSSSTRLRKIFTMPLSIEISVVTVGSRHKLTPSKPSLAP